MAYLAIEVSKLNWILIFLSEQCNIFVFVTPPLVIYHIFIGEVLGFEKHKGPLAEFVEETDDLYRFQDSKDLGLLDAKGYSLIMVSFSVLDLENHLGEIHACRHCYVFGVFV